MVLYYKDGQVFAHPSSSTVSAEFQDAILNEQVCRQILSRLEQIKFQEILLYILLAIGMGIPLGYIIGLVAPVG